MVAGKITAHVFAATNQPDTDWVVKVCDVDTSGRSINIQETIQRARFAGGTDLARPIPAGNVTEFVLDVGTCAHVFKAGHRVRLQVASSHFPHWDRNLNTGNPVGTEKLSVHNHLFPAANTGLAYIRNQPKIVEAHQEFLKGVMRVDIFGLRENGAVDGKLIAPLRPTVPTLKPGQKYLLETVIRTVKMGHPFTQGTADSNEVWMDVTVRSGRFGRRLHSPLPSTTPGSEPSSKLITIGMSMRPATPCARAATRAPNRRAWAFGTSRPSRAGHAR